MTELPRLVLAREHIQQGLTPKMLARGCTSGARPAAARSVRGRRLGCLHPWEQYRLKVQAAAETSAATTVFAWHSAASVWGVPTVGHRHPVHALRFQNDGGRSRAGVRRHYADPDGVRVFRHDGLLVTGRVRTALDLATFTPFAEAIVPLDHVLRPDVARNLPALSKEELLAEIEGYCTAAAARRITLAIEFADPLSASAGESYSRALMHVAGFETPALQHEIRDGAGLIGYSNYYWDGARVVGEFDGVEKVHEAGIPEGPDPVAGSGGREIPGGQDPGHWLRSGAMGVGRPDDAGTAGTEAGDGRRAPPSCPVRTVTRCSGDAQNSP